MTLIDATDRFARRAAILPEEFWEAREHLWLTREAARRRLAPPDIVMGALLARVAVCADPRLRIEPVIGYPSPLGLYVAGAAPSSGGKTTSMGIAAELFPWVPAHARCDQQPPASGEAMLEMFWAEEEDEDGKTVRVRSISSLLLPIDEGSLIERLGERSGVTLSPFLLTGFTGGTLGTETISSQRTGGRSLAGGSYVLSLVVAMQPRKAAALLQQRDSGLAQRFLWFWDRDPGAPRQRNGHEGRLEPLPVSLPSGPYHGRELHNGLIGLRAHDDVRDEIWMATALRRDPDLYAFDEAEDWGHDLLIRLRVSHCLALLDGRLDVTLEDWALGGMVASVSASVRMGVIGVLKNQDEWKKRTQVEMAVMQSEAVAIRREERTLDTVAASVLRYVRKNGPCTSIPPRVLSKKQRPFLQEALERHLDVGNIVFDPVECVYTAYQP